MDIDGRSGLRDADHGEGGVIAADEIVVFARVQGEGRALVIELDADLHISAKHRIVDGACVDIDAIRGGKGQFDGFNHGVIIDDDGACLAVI